jgi:hypothetical protein
MQDGKKCPRCQVLKPRDGFARNRARKDGLQVHCRDCYVAHARRSYAKHRDRVLERSRESYLRNKERRNEQGRQWIANNRERFRELTRKWARENGERRRKGARRLYAKCPERFRNYVATHRAWKMQATPKWASREAIEAIYAEAAKHGMDVDHIVPLQSKHVCGLHCEANLQPLPPSKNKSKGNRHWPDMW